MTSLTQLIGHIARLTAIIGGFVLLALVVLICASVAGRGLNTFAHSDWLASHAPGLGRWLIDTGVGAIRGDFEVLEASIATVIFASLPLCQFVSGHATVNILTRLLPARAQRVLRAFWEVVLAGVIVLIGLRLWEGLQSKLSNGQTTFIVELPVWWGYAASFAACAIAMLVAVFCALSRVMALFTGNDSLPEADMNAH